MSLLWEPIRDAAYERGWPFVALEFAGLCGCLLLAVALVVIFGALLCAR